ncbi:TPA: preprotein translocase subunit SecA, partial [Escherichia coli]
KIFTCLDTTRDFIDYIQARENLLTTSDKYIKIYSINLKMRV